MISKSSNLGDEHYSMLDYCISVTWSDLCRFEHLVPHLVQCATNHALSLLGCLSHHPGRQYISVYILRRELSTL
jgi:hypothetical protein